ncbi:hypothetical protein PHMEG_00028239 [Phytophthora megakarya]|uniref:Uncharacterized protein n=1 Tax=Phytophthora megakarya TaxID=4795 RepID=A0A225V5C8_9STRA|nr:hypothetical protein PHMEG_00028239 [Phytophthora megakarya]
MMRVCSHRESEFTADNQLRQRRQGLAIVAAAATESHHYSRMASYAPWLLYDDYLLEDEDSKLGFGNTFGELRTINENVGCTTKTKKRTYDAPFRWIK